MNDARRYLSRQSLAQQCETARECVSLRLDGELSELEEAMLRRHVAGCADCRTFEEATESFTTRLRSAPLETPAPVFAPQLQAGGRRRFIGVGAFAAALAAAAAVLFAPAASCSRSRASSTPARRRVTETPKPRGTPESCREIYCRSAQDRTPRGRRPDRRGAAASRRRPRARGRDGRHRRSRARHRRGRHRRPDLGSRRRQTLGRVWNVLGDPVDEKPAAPPARALVDPPRPAAFKDLTSEGRDLRDRHQGDRPDRPVRARRQDRPVRRRRRRQDGADPGADPQHRPQHGGVSVFSGVGERTREGNDLCSR
jgi:hypothetical protein